MGGGSYSRDVGRSSSSGSFSSGGTSSSRAKSDLSQYGLHNDLKPNRVITSLKESPIVIALDVTGSNREFSRIVYDKAPMLHGQIEQQGYLKDFDICFTAVGDAYCDRAPLQVCDFDYGINLDKHLKKLFLEGGGGGQTMETYELAAHYFNTKCEMPNAKMPFFFYIGDEAPYPVVESRIIENVMGETAANTLESKLVFSKLYKKFEGNVFYLQNPYCGRDRDTAERIRSAWIQQIGVENTEKIIPVHEEKSVIDLILGVIAMTSHARTLDSYRTDMVQRGQTSTRVANVDKSLGQFETRVAKKPKQNAVSVPRKRSSRSRKRSGAKII